MQKQYSGIIREKISDQDWLGSDIEIVRAPRGTSSFILNGATQYNQKEVDNYSCTIHGAMGAYSDLTGYKFGIEDRLKLWQMALDEGATPGLGWYISSAVDLVRRFVNENCPIKVDYYRLDVGSELFGKAMRLGYSAVIGYRGSALYNQDKADGILDDIEFSNTLYCHCIRTAYSIFDEYDFLIDNYPYNSTNLYKVPTRNWNKLVDNNIVFKSAYIYVVQ